MQDAEAIVSHSFGALDDKINTNEVFVLGRSLGGAVAIYVINQLKPNIRGLILENTFTSMSDLIDKIFPFLKLIKNFLLKNHWPTKDRISFLKIPILFFMSAKDELIPIEQMQELYAKADNAKFKSKYIIKDGTHNESWIKAGREYFVKLGKFLKKCGVNLSNKSLNFHSYSDVEDLDGEEEEYNNFDNEKSPLNYPNNHSINQNDFFEIYENPPVKQRKKDQNERSNDNNVNKVDLRKIFDEKSVLDDVRKDHAINQVFLEDEYDLIKSNRKKD
jgi:hypothetical protein